MPTPPTPAAETALATFATWASRFFIGRAAARAAVVETTEQIGEIHRVRWTVRHRAVVVRQQETSSRARKLDEPLDPASFDPWAEDADSLPTRTRQLTTCETCSGGKRVACATCGGDGQVTCDTCQGSGRVYSTRSHQHVSCRACGGDGLKACACRTGARKCPVCGGKGRAERWLEVEERRATTVWAAGDDRLCPLFEGLQAPASFDVDPAFWPFPLQQDFAGGPSDPVPAALVGVLHRAAKGAPPLGPHDRLSETRVQRFEAPVVHLAYALGGARGEVDVVVGREPRLQEGPRSRSPFHARQGWLVVAAVAAGVWGLGLFLWYVGRHSWYAAQPAALLLPGLTALGVLAALPLAATLCLPRPAWHALRLVPALLALAAVGTGQLAAAASGAPSAASAARRAAQGDGVAALTEAAAAADLGLDREAASTLHDRLALEALDGFTDAHTTWEAASRHFYTDAGRERARATAVARLKADLADRLTRETLDAAPADLARLQEAAPADAEVQQLAARLHVVSALACVASRDAACVHHEVAAARTLGASDQVLQAVEQRLDAAVGETVTQLWTTIRKDRSAQARVDACKAIEPHLVFLSAAGAPEGRYPTVATATDPCERAVDLLAAEQARARKREEAAARARAYRPVRCRDGTRSPSCICGGSWRGCCSHHGGVAGCD